MDSVKANRRNKPEEDVRKFIIDYLVENYNYNKSLFRIERKIENINQQFRPDVVIYNSDCTPFMVIECKAKNVKISQDHIFQIINYNNFLNSRYILVTNGAKIFCWKLLGNEYIKSEIPKFGSE